MRYGVTLIVDASVYVEVDADSEERALKLALDMEHDLSMCHRCAERVEIADILDDGHLVDLVEESE